MQSTLLCRALSSAEHASLQSTLLCRHSSLQSTLLCRARFFAEHASLQSTLLCTAPRSTGLLEGHLPKPFCQVWNVDASGIQIGRAHQILGFPIKTKQTWPSRKDTTPNSYPIFSKATPPEPLGSLTSEGSPLLVR